MEGHADILYRQFKVAVLTRNDEETMMEMTLYFRDVAIGIAKEAFCSDGVWYGTFVPLENDDHIDLRRRVAEFITFCEKWNEEARTGDANLSQFMAFSDVLTKGRWFAKSSQGNRNVLIEDAPNFFVGDEVTFRVEEWGQTKVSQTKVSGTDYDFGS